MNAPVLPLLVYQEISQNISILSFSGISQEVHGSVLHEIQYPGIEKGRDYYMNDSRKV